MHPGVVSEGTSTARYSCHSRQLALLGKGRGTGVAREGGRCLFIHGFWFLPALGPGSGVA